MSNQVEDGVAVDRLREIALSTRGDAVEYGEISPCPAVVPQRLSRRFSAQQVADAVQRYQAGESSPSIANDLGVAPSALVRLLRENEVTVRNTRVTVKQAKQMAKEYEAGATMRELEARYALSHGAVYRALHRVGITPRKQAPRPLT